MMSQRKRGRFSYDEPEPEDEHRERKVRFPKGKKDSQKWDVSVVYEGEEEDTPIKSTDPRVAATARAVKRSRAVGNSEEISIPADVYEAEEDYEESDEEETGEIAIEPFNLRKEREEGYFDAEGNYVEYVNENIKDAWLDSAQVDTSIAAKHLKRYSEQEVERTLLPKDLAAIKRRIADALQPGETVLKALRRLKSTSTEKDKNLKARMSTKTKEIFDRLTEDAMALLDNGDIDVYNEKKETFEREAEGYEALDRARRGILDNASTSGHFNGTAEDRNLFNDKGKENQASGNPTGTSVDMFAEDEQDIVGAANQENLDENTIKPKDGQTLQNSETVQIDMFTGDDIEKTGGSSGVPGLMVYLYLSLSVRL
ncbi:hypothetical protein KP509_33G054200 [Ceratopteris richardii]|uniref:CD2 antigen cytoplasmic tail-binding protein 2 n=1 Tax=Ceratopteris richardii TaxID=49495 RepID=A0A8T2QR78_CERRI|nr:hypothetical protein KP509_33G054200 [Ceratopteris richardii]